MFMASQCRGAGTQVAHCLPWPARPTRRPSCLLGTVATSGRASPAGAPCAAGVSGGIQHRQQAPIAQHDGIQPAVRVGQPGGRHGHPARSVRVAYREHDSAIDIVVVLDRTIPQPKQHPHLRRSGIARMSDRKEGQWGSLLPMRAEVPCMMCCIIAI